MATGKRIRGLGAVKPHVKAAAQEIAEKFNVWYIGGFASSGHIPGSDHYTGHALDVMTSNGQPIADWTVANAARLSVKYVIWNRRIWDSRDKRGWTPYTGSSPHTDHVHISFNSPPGDGSAPVDAIGNRADSDTAGNDWWPLFVKWFFGR